MQVILRSKPDCQELPVRVKYSCSPTRSPNELLPFRRQRLRNVSISVVALIIIASGTLRAPVTRGEAVSTHGPSALCHVTDGAFTMCPNGSEEWSDITPKYFSDSNSYLYADQADLDPTKDIGQSPTDTFMLMYDECGTTEPLSPDGYFQVHFNTVGLDEGKERLEHYVLHIYGDATLMFFEDGKLAPWPERNCRGHEGRSKLRDLSELWLQSPYG